MSKRSKKKGKGSANNDNGSASKRATGENKYKDDDNYIAMIPTDSFGEAGYKVRDDKLLRLSDAVFDLGADEKQLDAKRQVQHWDRKRKSTLKSASTRLTRQAGARTKVEIAATIAKEEGSKSRIKSRFSISIRSG